MALRFDQLESETEARRRARSASPGYPTDLPVPARGAPPPLQQVAQAGGIKGLPEGAVLEPPIKGLPEGATLEPPSGSKTERFLENVTPQGPISGLIALIRTSSQAAKGQRPDLLTNPEGAIPEAVQGGAVAGTGLRPRLGRPTPEAPPVPEPAPLQLTSRLSPQEAHAIARAEKLAPARLEAKQVAQRLRDTGQMPPESSGPPIEVSGPTSAPYNLPSAQTVREMGAVQKGIALRDKLNPASEQNVTARDQAILSALRPHIKTIMGRSEASVAALESALPQDVLTQALSQPPKAASIANWLQVYERAARGKFSPQAKASLELATKNLNNNLGTDLTIKDILRSQ
jgi:hypothetical protein